MQSLRFVVALGAMVAAVACGSADDGGQTDSEGGASGAGLDGAGGKTGFDHYAGGGGGDAVAPPSSSGSLTSDAAGIRESGPSSTDGSVLPSMGDGADAGNGGADAKGAGSADASDAASGNNDGGSGACQGGKTLLASDATGSGATPVSGYGELHFNASTSTQIVDLTTTLAVPKPPASSSTLFIWPGLEPLPGSKNYQPIGIGVLQPVLTWGTSCAPNSPPTPSGWWISGQYVNPYTSDQSHYGCFGGNVIDVQTTDLLDITMSLKGTAWTQVVIDRASGQKSTFNMDLAAQAQDWALFKIELPTQAKPSSDIVFTSTVLTFATADPAACQPSTRGTNDYFAAPELSADGTKCCVSRMILRAQGVAATTQDGP